MGRDGKCDKKTKRRIKGMEMPKFAPKVAKQSIGFYKKIFEKTFGTLMTLQEQMLKMLEVAPGLPGGGKEKLVELNKTYKKICVDFKSAVDEKVLARVEELFAANEAPVKKAAAKPRAKNA
jgi:hypothetical protein